MGEGGPAGGCDILVLVGGGLGHYRPVGDLVAELADGLDVVVAASAAPDSTVARAAEADGFRYVHLGLTEQAGGLDRVLVRAVRTFDRRVLPILAARGPADAPVPPRSARIAFTIGNLAKPLASSRPGWLHAVDEVVARTRPALVMADIHVGQAMPWVAARQGVRWVQFTTGPPDVAGPGAPPAGPGLPTAPTGTDRLAARLLGAVAHVRRRRDLRRVAQGLPLTPPTAPVPPLHRFTFSAAVLDRVGLPPATTPRHLGVALDPAPDPGVAPSAQEPGAPEGPPSGDRPLVFVAFGSVAVAADREAAFASALGRVAEAGFRVVVQSAEPSLVAALAAGSHEGVELVAPTGRPPHPWYRQAALVVGHGGWGTIREALSHGVPVLVLSALRGDRMDTARRVVESGAGASASPYVVTAEGLAATIVAMASDDGLHRRAAEVAAALHSGPRAQVGEELRALALAR